MRPEYAISIAFFATWLVYVYARIAKLRRISRQQAAWRTMLDDSARRDGETEDEWAQRVLAARSK